MSDVSSISPEQDALVIAFTIEELSVGGAEHMLTEMANSFSKRGWQVHMICISMAGELASRLDDGVQLHVLGKRLGFDIRFPWRLIRCINKIKPDVINSHLWVANSWTRLSLFLHGTPIVVTEHSRDSWKPMLYRLADRVFILKTYRMITVSHDTADFYIKEIGIDSNMITVINNGVDTRHYASGNGDRLRETWLGMQEHQAGDNPKQQMHVGTVGRLVAAKNHTRLIDAIAKLINDPQLTEHYQFHLTIVGEGEERANIEKYIENLDLTHCIRLAGVRHDVADVLASFDVFVLSSDREGHPLTALEAQAAGIPVVLTDAGGSAEAIARQDGQSGGVLVPTCADALSDELRKILTDPDKRSRQSEFGQRYALENFDRRQMINRYEAVFKEAIAHS